MSIGTAVRHRLGRLEPWAAEAYRSWFVDLDELASVLAPLGPLATIVEIGCGEGSLATRLVDAFPDARYVGIDPAPDIGRLYRGDGTRAEFRNSSTAELAAEYAGHFDLAVVADVLHHVAPAERSTFLRSAATLVRKGGLVAVKDWERRRDLATLAATISDRYITGDRAVRFDDLASLRSLVAGAVGPSDPVVEARIRPRSNNVLLVRRKH